MNVNELLQLLKNANSKYNEDNENYYTDAETYTNIETEDFLNYEY